MNTKVIGAPEYPVNDGWIQTFTGRKVYPMALKVEDINITDIAHALSKQCRFAGHCSSFYSVAEHSMIISWQVPDNQALWGLLHDAAEAYLIDLPRPLKHLPAFAPYRQAEARAMQVIATKFGLRDRMPDSVKRADKQLLATEAQQLMAPLHPEWDIKPPAVQPIEIEIECLQPDEAKELFLARFHELVEENGGQTDE